MYLKGKYRLFYELNFPIENSVLIVNFILSNCRLHLKNALQNLDWLVKFDEVMIGDARALSFVSTAGEDLAISNKSNICTWRSQKCYMQVRFTCTKYILDPEIFLKI